MSNRKKISQDAIPAALEKAKHYRLLNEPWHAESICIDILQSDPDNQEAAYTMIMAITDQYGHRFKKSIRQSLEKTNLLTNEYEQSYCRGLIYERQATTALKRGTPRANYIAYDYLMSAIEWYEKAEKIKPDKNDESILRWNSCQRLIEEYQLEPASEEIDVHPLLDV